MKTAELIWVLWIIIGASGIITSLVVLPPTAVSLMIISARIDEAENNLRLVSNRVNSLQQRVRDLEKDKHDGKE